MIRLPVALPLTLVLPALLLVAGASGAAAAPDAPRVVDLEATPRPDGSYSTGLRLEGAMSEAILEEIDSGLPVSFLYRVEIVRRRNVWNDVLLHHDVEVAVEMDSLTRQYRLTRKVDGTVVNSLATEKHEDMERWMTRLEDLVIGPLPAGEPVDEEVYLRARCRVSASFVMFFFPKIKKTDWARISLPAPETTDGD